MPTEFSWSVSRHDVFDSCKRKYYFSYYAHQGGWKADASPLAKKIYFLKKLEPAVMWTGSVVHRAIRYAIVNRHVTSKEKVLDFLMKRLTLDHKASMELDREKATPKDFLLFEHYKGIEVSIDQIKEKAMICFSNFFGGDYFKELMEISDQHFLYIDPEKDDVASMKFLWNDLSIYAIPDICYRDKNGVIKLLDWKTGKAPENDLSEQLKIYAWRLQHLDGIDPDVHEVFASSVYLLDNAQRGRKIVKEDIDSVVHTIKESIAQMKAFMYDPEKNIPLEMEEFQMTDNIKKCSSCVFAEVCERD